MESKCYEGSLSVAPFDFSPFVCCRRVEWAFNPLWVTAQGEQAGRVGARVALLDEGVGAGIP
ncbi:MAG TPA: hypothetical protein IGR15_11775 [Synechococcus sp. M44_DOE_062]|nr:hypothetical protein [Synechococcus sp. M44_DOE_062]